ncbi:fimbrial protein, partial [Enterobacter ludwigii]
MKKNTANWLLMCLISVSALVSAGTKKIDTGSSAYLKAYILDNTCSVDTGAASVFLGNYSVNDLSDTDSLTPEVRFSIVLKNCGASAKKVNVFAEGEADAFNQKGALAIEKNATN